MKRKLTVGWGKEFLKSLIIKRRNYLIYRMYSTQFYNYIKSQGFSIKQQPGEETFMKKWSQISDRVDVWSYRFFSHYSPGNSNIVPEDIGHTIIEAKLDPERFRPYYSDKNMYHLYVPKDALASTILCRINGSRLLDNN